MKGILFIVLFIITITIIPSFVESLCSCKGWKKWACPRCFRSCPRKEHQMEEIEKIFKTSLFGQDEAASLIRNALSTRTGTKPLTLHFTGPNGVGKSLAARLLAEGLFEYPKNDRGLVWISGKNYQHATSEAEIKAAKREIRYEIINHLYRCQHSLIVFDEAEMVSSEILWVLNDFIDTVHTQVIDTFNRHLKVDTSNAIIVLISDFGKESVTNDISFADMSDYVIEITDIILRNKAMVDRIQYIVPFMPIPHLNCEEHKWIGPEPPKSVQKLVSTVIAKIRDHPWITTKFNPSKVEITANVDTISREVMHIMAASVYCKRNYRGVEQLIENEVISKTLPTLHKILSGQTKPSSITIEVRSMHKNPLVNGHYSKKREL